MIGPQGELDVFHCPLDGIQLIEASAGTGKTWNICGLYLRLLLERKHSVREILVVTFTNAATAELRERIRARLLDLSRALDRDGVDASDPFVQRFLERIREDPGFDQREVRDRLRMALLSFDEAAIFTIHGFCQRALADAPFAAALPFRFELVPDDRDIRREVATDFWRKHVVHAPLERDFADFLLSTGSGPDWLLEHLTQHLRKPLARPIWPDFAGLEETSQDGEEVRRRFDAAAQTWHDQAPAIVEALLQALPQLNGTTYKPATVETAAGQWGNYFTGAEPAAEPGDKQHLLSAGTLEAKTKKKCVPPEHPFFQQAQALLDSCGRWQQHMQLRRLRLLRDWLDDAPAELARRKQARRLVAFDDLLDKLHRALGGGAYPWLAESLRRRFPCALVDEFQDTDPLQFGIFRQVYGQSGAPLFLVGDPKQAIYSFRGADLHTYLEARREAVRCHTLSANHRSSTFLIRACNALFGANARAFALEGLHYHPVSRGAKPHPPWRDSTEARGELELWTLPFGGDGNPLLKGELLERVAASCAAEIARLLDGAAAGRVTIAGLPLRAADIAVIVRSHRQGSLIKRALALCGVAAVELSQQSIFAGEQAEEVERVLSAIADPTHGGLLKTALATEILGLDGNAIYRLGEDEGRLADWLERFQAYRRTWQEQGFAAMWQSLLREQGTAARVLASPAGERKLTNLLHLGELLAGATDPRAGMETLLRWLAERRRDPGMDEVEQLRLESDDNLVQILTVHKSKGLEFPVVFCPYLWDGASRASRRNGREYVAYHAGADAVLDYSLDEEHQATAQRTAAMEDAAETLRLIYVALTRAVHRCYLVAGSYLTQHGRNFSAKECGRSPLNWLVAGNGTDFDTWLDGAVSAPAIDAAWNALATADPDGIRRVVLPETATAVARTPPDEAEPIEARHMSRHVTETWRLGSYSFLSRRGPSDNALPDHDALPADAIAGPDPEPGAAIAADDILRFPRGEKAGVCLHRALELADFTDAKSCHQAIAQALAEYPQSGEDPDELSGMMKTLFADLLTTPLRDGLRLDSVPLHKRLSELEFCFPVDHLAPRVLERWLQAHGYRHPPLTFPAFSGYLKGFIDLVFEQGGRYYLLDWKSNHLGTQAADYSTAALALAMDEHGYHLQSLCYTVALHRHLRRHLPDYRYESQFGGCFYLFLRGVRPHWREPDGGPHGVFYHCPAPATIADLDALFSSAIAEERP